MCSCLKAIWFNSTYSIMEIYFPDTDCALLGREIKKNFLEIVPLNFVAKFSFVSYNLCAKNISKKHTIFSISAIYLWIAFTSTAVTVDDGIEYGNGSYESYQTHLWLFIHTNKTGVSLKLLLFYFKSCKYQRSQSERPSGPNHDRSRRTQIDWN